MALASPSHAVSPPTTGGSHRLPDPQIHLGPEASRNGAPHDLRTAQPVAGGSVCSTGLCSDSKLTQSYQFCNLKCNIRQTRRTSGPVESRLWKTESSMEGEQEEWRSTQGLHKDALPEPGSLGGEHQSQAPQRSEQ